MCCLYNSSTACMSVVQFWSHIFLSVWPFQSDFLINCLQNHFTFNQNRSRLSGGRRWEEPKGIVQNLKNCSIFLYMIDQKSFSSLFFLFNSSCVTQKPCSDSALKCVLRDLITSGHWLEHLFTSGIKMYSQMCPVWLHLSLCASKWEH